MKWLKHVFVATAITLAISVPAHAAEQISNFNSQISVQKSGRVDVVETINYDFGYASRHGIYRYIPVVYHSDDGKTYKPNLTIDSVMLDDQPAKFAISQDGDNKVAKIGNANSTITGPHMYSIAYHFDSLLLNKGGDLLRYNVTASGWEVPIQKVTATVSGPSIAKLACYTGAVGATDKNCQIDDETRSIRAANVAGGEGLTLDALWPSGTVTSLMQPYVTPAWLTALYLLGGAYVLVGFGLIIAALLRWLGIRRAEKHAQRDQTVIAQYQAPANLTPGELGFISDNKATLVEVTATLIQAAVLGFITIEQIAEKSLLKKAEYKLTKRKDFSGLNRDESLLLLAIFDGKEELNLKDVNKTRVPQAIKDYQAAIKENTKAKGLYTSTSKFSVPAASLVILTFALFTPLIFVACFAIVPLSLYLYKRAGQTPRRTPEGLKIWAEVEGFKLFLSVTEKDRLAFTDAPARTPKQFSAFLPYAIALGVEKQWASQFEGIDVANSMGWYGGNTQAFTAGYLVGSLSDSFASSVAASVAPQTSSGGFGGGSAGGGFGGGGGGSW